MEIIASILLLIDGVIYNAIKYIYNIFNFMAGVNIFNDAAYQDITAKIYTILGLIMMFVLAYTLLKAVMNPDDFAKGEKSFPNIIKNVIISLVLIVVMPAIFSFAMDFQASILNNNTIYKFVLGRENLEEETVNIGSQVAYYTFTSFFYPSEEFCTNGSGNMTSEQAIACKSEIKSNGSTWYRPSTWFSNDVVTLAEVDSLVESGQASFTNYNDFSEAVADNEISYSMIISTVAGVFVLYVLLNFCFDIAVRVIKLAFYQLIAPIPIICRILPGGNMKDVFDKWTKQTISVYVEVFIRIATMALGVYLITLVIDAFNTGIPNIDSLGFVARMIVRALLIMAVIIFIRQAPKLIGDIFHLDTGGMKLGIMDKLAMGGALTAGAAAGGLATTGVRNFTGAFTGKGIAKDLKNKQFKSAFKKIGKSAVSGTFSGAAGATSGFVRAGKAGLNAKNFKDMKGAASTGSKAAIDKKNKRIAYKASHQQATAFGHHLDVKGLMPLHPQIGAAIENTVGVGLGHIGDTFHKAKQWVGIDMGLDALNHEKSIADEMMGFYKTMAGYVEDNEMVANYAGLYEAERKSEISNTVFDSKRYQDSLDARVSMMQNDSKYRGMNTNELYNLAASEINKDQFTRKRTTAEMQAAIEERQTKLKMYDNLKKMATIKAVNEKLNEKSADGTIIDGRFQAVANQVEVFKKQNASFDFVRDMHSIEGVTWDSNWDAIMNSGDADAINALMKDFKSAQSPVSFFGDSEMGKNKSGEISAQIATKIQEKKKDK